MIIDKIKYLVVLLLIVFLSSCLTENLPVIKTAREKYGLCGNVKSVRNFISDGSMFIDTTNEIPMKLLDQIIFYSDGREKESFAYDIGSVPVHTDFTYDSNSTLVSKSIRINRVKMAAVKYLYANNGLLKEESKFISDSELDEKITYEWDEELDTLKILLYDKSNNLINKQIIEYENGSKTGWRSYYDKSNVLRFYSKYLNGAEIERNTFSDKGLLMERLIITNDKKGNPIKAETVSLSSAKVVWEKGYKYDSAGNWIKQTHVESGKVLYVLGRQLIYF